jgi:zinc protease
MRHDPLKSIDSRWFVADPSRPVFSLCLAIPDGARNDPAGLAGLTHLTTRMVQRGAGNMDRKTFLEAVDRLGASLDISASRHHVLIWIDGLARHFDALVELLALALDAPRHDEGEFAKLVRETLAELDEVRDDDSALGGRAFARALYGDHPYGRPVKGCRESLGRIDVAAIAARHHALFASPHVLVGCAGAVAPERVAQAVARVFPRRRDGGGGTEVVEVPELQRRSGLRITVVDKPERSQTQLFIGQPSLPLHHPDWTALQVAQTGFGGIFTAPFAHEIREKRGWSYSVWSALQSDAWLGTFQMRLHPNTPECLPALQLSLELLADFARRGPDPVAFEAARQNLARGHVFATDTATRLMWERLNTELSGLPPEWLDDAVERYRGIDLARGIDAATRHISATDLTVTIVCTASEIAPRLEALEGVSSIDVVDWEFDLSDPMS